MEASVQLEVWYDDVPPSLNRIGTRGSHWPVTNAKKRWTKILDDVLLSAKLTRGCNRVHATAALRFPTRLRRDEGNFRWLLEKALGDALVNGGWLADDDVGHFTFGEVTIEDERGPKRTTIVLEVQ